MSSREEIPALRRQTQGMDAQALIAYALGRFGEGVAFSSSLGVEDQVLTDMLARTRAKPPIFTLDTGRLPQETYDLIDATRKRYGIEIEVLFPDRTEVEQLVAEGGVNLFYASVESRQACCRVRKVLPLAGKLATLEAWMTGQRREQAVTRRRIEAVEWDETFQLVKFNPLADWTSGQVWDYVKAHDVPTNALHDRGYPSIGCAPCTRAIQPGEDIRAGRWWWELPEHKECGLHVVNGQLVRKVR